MEQQLLQQDQEVPALLVPVLGMTLLLPTVSVAELVPFRKTRYLNLDSPVNGMLGYYEWRDQRVPLLSFELANGLPSSDVSDYRQVAIIHATGVDENTAYIAILAQGIPHVARVSENNISEDFSQRALDYCKQFVTVDERSAVIPDIVSLENLVAELHA